MELKKIRFRYYQPRFLIENTVSIFFKTVFKPVSSYRRLKQWRRQLLKTISLEGSEKLGWFVVLPLIFGPITSLKR